MPSYVFRGHYPTAYTAGRDANGANIGLVEPGDVRLFDEPPSDGFWVPEIPPRDGEDESRDEVPQDAGPATEGDAGEPPQDEPGAAQDEDPQDQPGE